MLGILCIGASCTICVPPCGSGAAASSCCSCATLVGCCQLAGGKSKGGWSGVHLFDLITQHPSFCETSPTTFYCSNQSATSHNAHLSSTTNLYYTDTEYKVQQRSISKRLNLRLQTSVTATGLKTTQSDNITHSCNSFSGKVHILNFSSSPPTHPPSLLPAQHSIATKHHIEENTLKTWCTLFHLSTTSSCVVAPQLGAGLWDGACCPWSASSLNPW